MKNLKINIYDEAGPGDCRRFGTGKENILEIKLSDEEHASLKSVLESRAVVFAPEDWSAAVKQALPELHDKIMGKVKDHVRRKMIRRMAFEEGCFDIPEDEVIKADIKSGLWKPEWLPENADIDNIVLAEISDEYTLDYIDWLKTRDEYFVNERLQLNPALPDGTYGYYFTPDAIEE